jgi:hypothetical protein
MERAFHASCPWRFFVTASIEKGEIHSVELLSQGGAACRLRNPWAGSTVEILRHGGRTESLTGSLLAFQTVKDEKIVLGRL